MKTKLLIFDSHPVQYRVPIWQILEMIERNSIHVVYASDCSVRGYNDKGFSKVFAWDEPLLSGYKYTILNCVKQEPLSGWGSLTGKGVKRLIEELKPKAIVITGLNYRYDLVAYIHARRRGIPIWLRCETQDFSFNRSKLKSLFRSMLYRLAYKGFDRVFYIGELNKQHYLYHGVPETKLIPALYGTVDRFLNMDNTEKKKLRLFSREKAGINDTDFVIGFSGKFIYKKHPDILFEMLESLPEELRCRVRLYFLGSGELENSLRCKSEEVLQRFGVQSFFAGFVNQSQLTSHYLAMDILVLPSRKMGETWGLVVNEAMQAGCGVIVSDAVGCSADFHSWDRFRIFKEGDAVGLSACVADLAKFSRDFEWATKKMKAYSIGSAASAFIENIKTL